MRIVVTTCDKHSWLLDTFFHFFEKAWPDCPFARTIITETTPSERKGVEVYQGGEESSWAGRLLGYLGECPDNWILLLLEDYIIENIVVGEFYRALSIVEGESIGCIRVTNVDRYGERKYCRPSSYPGFYEYPLEAPYALSTQASIWNRSYLQNLLREGESIWQTEVKGSKRVPSHPKKILWAKNTIFNYHPGGYIKKGKLRSPQLEKWVKENW